MASFVIGLLMLLASWGVSSNYSYWKDELFTAAAIADSWSGLLHRWILPDTAPPLYGLLLKGWAGLAGSSEWGLRSLSLMFAALSLITASIFRAHVKPLGMLATILFLGLSPTFVGHAQEARNYALTLFWATCLTGSSLALVRRGFVPGSSPGPSAMGVVYAASALALSLSHYFGYLFAGVVLLVDLGWRTFPSKPVATLGALIFMQAWPIFHFVLNNPASNRLDKVSWIQVTPVIGTLQEYLAGVFPILGIQAALVLFGLGSGALLFPGIRKGCIRAIRRAGNQAAEQSNETSHLLLLLGAFALLMLIVDLIHPLSTSRNYVVALPATAFLVGNLALLVQSQAQRGWAWIGLALLATVLIALFANSLNDLRQKTMPMMNYKLMAEIVERSKICAGGCRTKSSPARLSPYFAPSLLLPYKDSRDEDNAQPILGLGENSSIMRRLRLNHPHMSCYEPPQSKTGSVFLLIKPEQVSASALEGLTPCL